MSSITNNIDLRAFEPFSADETVKKVVALTANDTPRIKIDKNDPDWMDKLWNAVDRDADYETPIDYDNAKEHEKYIRNLNDQTEMDAIGWPVAGPLTFNMSPRKMREVTLKTFKEMRQAGHLLTQEEFDKQYKKDDFFFADGQLSLSRYFGAKFLRDKLTSDGYQDYDAAVPILIIGATDEIPFSVNIDNAYEIPFLEFSEGFKEVTLTSKLITGVDATSNIFERGPFLKFGYVDWGGIGNLRYSGDRKKVYAIDTERKSFEPNFDNQKNERLKYLHKRFEVLSGTNTNLAFTISVKDILNQNEY